VFTYLCLVSLQFKQGRIISSVANTLEEREDWSRVSMSAYDICSPQATGLLHFKPCSFVSMCLLSMDITTTAMSGKFRLYFIC